MWNFRKTDPKQPQPEEKEPVTSGTPETGGDEWAFLRDQPDFDADEMSTVRSSRDWDDDYDSTPPVYTDWPTDPISEAAAAEAAEAGAWAAAEPEPQGAAMGWSSGPSAVPTEAELQFLRDTAPAAEPVYDESSELDAPLPPPHAGLDPGVDLLDIALRKSEDAGLLKKEQAHPQFHRPQMRTWDD
jgi:hypothetical protein